MFYGFDIFYFTLIIPAMLFAAYAQMRVSSTFKKYSKFGSVSNMTGKYVAEMILNLNGITDVRVVPISGKLTDNFNPKTKTVNLSEPVYNSTSIAAIGVAAHEVGHAIQYANSYAPIKFRNAIIGVTNIGSKLAWPLLIIGLIFNFQALFLVGIIFFCTILVFQIATLPVEFNASSRAIRTLSAGYLPPQEISGVKKVLHAAALTYVAAVIVSLAQVIRLILIFRRNN